MRLTDPKSALVLVLYPLPVVVAWAVLPENHSGGHLAMRFPPVESLPNPWHEEVESFRRRPSGRLMMCLYREERTPRP